MREFFSARDYIARAENTESESVPAARDYIIKLGRPFILPPPAHFTSSQDNELLKMNPQSFVNLCKIVQLKRTKASYLTICKLDLSRALK